MAETYGPLVRLWGIHPAQLPSPTATAEELTPFLTSVLLEALPFTNTVPTTSAAPSATPWKTKGTKTYAHSDAPVHLYERSVSAADLQAIVEAHTDIPHLAQAASSQAETWVLRRSVHKDVAETGTAAWNEWKRSFKDEHAEAEKAFTPTVLRTAVKQQWDCTGVVVEYEGDTWTDWTLKLEESVHKMPPPLQDRLFPVLQATAAVAGRREFLVVQMAARDAAGKEEEGGLVRGAYSSIERVRETAEGGDNEWLMGTVSDAKGVLPAWLQRMAVPGQVAKDVDMFLKWIATERKKKKAEAVEATDVVGGGEA